MVERWGQARWCICRCVEQQTLGRVRARSRRCRVVVVVVASIRLCDQDEGGYRHTRSQAVQRIRTAPGEAPCDPSSESMRIYKAVGNGGEADMRPGPPPAPHLPVKPTAVHPVAPSQVSSRQVPTYVSRPPAAPSTTLALCNSAAPGDRRMSGGAGLGYGQVVTLCVSCVPLCYILLLVPTKRGSFNIQSTEGRDSSSVPDSTTIVWARPNALQAMRCAVRRRTLHPRYGLNSQHFPACRGPFPDSCRSVATWMRS